MTKTCPAAPAHLREKCSNPIVNDQRKGDHGQKPAQDAPRSTFHGVSQTVQRLLAPSSFFDPTLEGADSEKHGDAGREGQGEAGKKEHEPE
jgi:hypothetical protein